MADINKFTTKEVLNKVLLDSSGNSVAAFSHTSQEAFNAVLDSTNSRLNVSLSGGTISGDVTISGDLTVEGGGSMSFSEAVTGDMKITGNVTSGSALYVYSNQIYTGTGNAAFVSLELDHASASGTVLDIRQDGTGDILNLRKASTNVMTVTPSGNLVFKSISNSGSSLGDGASLYLQKDDGAAMANDHVLGEIIFQGAEDASNNLITGARIFAENSRGSDWDSSNNHCDLVFQTTTGDNTLTEAMRIEDTGKIVMSPVDGQPVEIKPRSGISTVFSLKNASDTTLIGFHCALSTLSGHSNKPAFFASNDFQIFTTGSKTMSFGTNSVTRFQLDDDSRISLSNNDSNTSNTVFGKKAFVQGADGTTDIGNVGADFNVAIGETAMGADRTASNFQMNVGIGFGALRNLTTGDYNVSVGHLSSTSLTTGEKNYVIGREAFANSQAGVSNIAIGHQALPSINHTSNDGSIAIGDSALYSKNSSSGAQFNASAVAVGYRAGYSISSAEQCTLIGHDAGLGVTTGNNNTALGYDALGGNAGAGMTGANNTAIGRRAGYIMEGAVADCVVIGQSAGSALTTGSQNTFIGAQSGQGAVENGGNTSVGYKSFHNVGNASGTNNVAIGYEALMGGTGTATDNDANSSVAIGYRALQDVVDADHNIAIGYLASTNIVGGESNIAIGSSALTAGTNNTGNIAIGLSALSSASDGENYNIAIGFQAMQSVNATTTDHNIAMGQQAGKALTGDNNIAIGQGAMNNSSNAADGVVAIGKFALQGALGSGADSVVGIGQQALQSLTTGGNLVAIGYLAGDALTVGGNNVIIGDSAGSGMVEDRNCTAIGYYALIQSNGGGSDGNPSDTNNTAVGAFAGDALTNGANNVFLGANTDGSSGSAVNQIVIGTGAVGTGNNEIALGNTSISAIKAQVASITAYSSDERTKKDIKDYDLKGLDFVNDLQLKTYIYKNPVDFPDEIRSSKWDEDGAERPEDPTEVQVGLIAQEVEAALSKHEISNTETYAPTQESGIKTLTYGNLIFPLIKAVQELSTKVEELEAKLSK